MKSSVRTSIVALLITILVVGTISAIMFLVATDAQAQDLNVSVKGLDQVETYLVKSALVNHKLPLTTPVAIEKSIVKRDWNGLEKEFNAVKVMIETADGEFTGEVDGRSYPQLSGEEYYGLLELAINHACQGPEEFRQNAKLDRIFYEIRETITEEAKSRSYSVVFPDRISGATGTIFRINRTMCKVDFGPEENSSVYSMVYTDGVLRTVAGIDTIFEYAKK